MRIATGVCVLAAGLMFGSGAFAAADSDPSSSSSPGQSAEGTSQSTGSVSGVGASGLDNEPKSTIGATSNDATDPAGSTTPDESDDNSTTPLSTDDDEGSGAEETDPAGSETEAIGTGSTETETGAETPAVTTTDSSTTPDSASTPEYTPTPPPPGTLPPVNPMVPVWQAFEPMSDAVNKISNLMQSVPQTLASLQTSPTPIPDVIATVQEMLTSMADAVIPLGQVPGDIYALLGIPTTPPATPPLIGGSGVLHSAQAPPPAEAPLFGPQAGQVPQLVTSGAAGSSLFGTMAPRQPLGTAATTGLTREFSVSGIVPLATGAADTPQSLFEHVIEAVLVPASLTALAAVALPGVGGLLIVCAAGVRVGYRQAKAALALRASGIARFAGPGPLGVVRSGSRVMLRQRARGPRTKRAVCPEASRSPRVLEPAA
jgi:hypothetical protein